MNVTVCVCLLRHTLIMYSIVCSLECVLLAHFAGGPFLNDVKIREKYSMFHW